VRCPYMLDTPARSSAKLDPVEPTTGLAREGSRSRVDFAPLDQIWTDPLDQDARGNGSKEI